MYLLPGQGYQDGSRFIGLVVHLYDVLIFQMSGEPPNLELKKIRSMDEVSTPTDRLDSLPVCLVVP